ncbi:MAG: hypothetical protein PHF00_09195, partial [Elusimicrobia bacterium]|nr:hypothetical protein [Elusimicrobiota bacterium]
MAPAQGRVLLVTTDRGLAEDVARAAQTQGLALAEAAGSREAAAALASGPCAAVVVDFETLPPFARAEILALRGPN